MNAEEIREYCLSFPFTTEGFPFGGETLVFKVYEKMFALLDLQKAESINLKCNPEKAIILREEHSEILPGFHMNKKHWNTVLINESLSRDFIYSLIKDSYQLVYKSLPKKYLIQNHVD